MFEEPLPADLQQVEQEFSSFMQFDSGAEFSRRIGRAIREELRRERRAAGWKFALALTASVFLWLHLSFYIVPITDFHFRDVSPARPIHPPTIEPQAGFPHGSLFE